MAKPYEGRIVPKFDYMSKAVHVKWNGCVCQVDRCETRAFRQVERRGITTWWSGEAFSQVDRCETRTFRQVERRLVKWRGVA